MARPTGNPRSNLSRSRRDPRDRQSGASRGRANLRETYREMQKQREADRQARDDREAARNRQGTGGRNQPNTAAASRAGASGSQADRGYERSDQRPSQVNPRGGGRTGTQRTTPATAARTTPLATPVPVGSLPKKTTKTTKAVKYADTPDSRADRTANKPVQVNPRGGGRTGTQRDGASASSPALISKLTSTFANLGSRLNPTPIPAQSNIDAVMDQRFERQDVSGAPGTPGGAGGSLDDFLARREGHRFLTADQRAEARDAVQGLGANAARAILGPIGAPIAETFSRAFGGIPGAEAAPSPKLEYAARRPFPIRHPSQWPPDGMSAEEAYENDPSIQALRGVPAAQRNTFFGLQAAQREAEPAIAEQMRQLTPAQRNALTGLNPQMRKVNPIAQYYPHLSEQELSGGHLPTPSAPPTPAGTPVPVGSLPSARPAPYVGPGTGAARPGVVGSNAARPAPYVGPGTGNARPGVVSDNFQNQGVVGSAPPTPAGTPVPVGSLPDRGTLPSANQPSQVNPRGGGRTGPQRQDVASGNFNQLGGVGSGRRDFIGGNVGGNRISGYDPLSSANQGSIRRNPVVVPPQDQASLAPSGGVVGSSDYVQAGVIADPFAFHDRNFAPVDYAAIGDRGFVPPTPVGAGRETVVSDNFNRQAGVGSARRDFVGANVGAPVQVQTVGQPEAPVMQGGVPTPAPVAQPVVPPPSAVVAPGAQPEMSRQELLQQLPQPGTAPEVVQPPRPDGRVPIPRREEEGGGGGSTPTAPTTPTTPETTETYNHFANVPVQPHPEIARLTQEMNNLAASGSITQEQLQGYQQRIAQYEGMMVAANEAQRRISADIAAYNAWVAAGSRGDSGFTQYDQSNPDLWISPETRRYLQAIGPDVLGMALGTTPQFGGQPGQPGAGPGGVPVPPGADPSRPLHEYVDWRYQNAPNQFGGVDPKYYTASNELWRTPALRGGPPAPPPGAGTGQRPFATV